MTTAPAESQLLSNNKEHLFKLFNYSNNSMRIILNNNSPMFCASDICTILGLKNTTKAISTLDHDEKDDFTISDSIGRKQSTRFISESGLYALIFKSRKKEAKLFRKWVVSEVLPSIKDQSKIVRLTQSTNKTLSLGNVLIICRKKDGYINASQLCKAGNKSFKHWSENKNTKAYLRALEASVGIPTDELIKYNTGSNSERSTWVHRKVAIHMAQWISPAFAVKVTSWIYELEVQNNQLIAKVSQRMPILKGNGIFDCQLTLPNGKSMNIPMREDGYINITALCKANKKNYWKWKENKTSERVIKALETSLRIRRDVLIQTVSGGINENRGTWVHRRLGIIIAQWISAEVAVQVATWIEELLLTGSVTLGQEKSDQELEQIQKQLLDTQTELKKERRKLLAYKRKHSYHKFKKGACFYIISDAESCLCTDNCIRKNKYKVGIDGKDINLRLQQHRTDIPTLKIEYLAYTEDCDLLEKSILKKYREKLTPFKNHEWIYGIKIEEILENVGKITDLLEMKYTEEKEIHKYNEQISEIVKYLMDHFVNSEQEQGESEDDEEEDEEDDILTIEVNQNITEKTTITTTKERKCRQCGQTKPKNDQNFAKCGKGFRTICLECNPLKGKHKDCKCGKRIDAYAKMCLDCRSFVNRKVNRPSYRQLKRDLTKMSYVKVGKKYGVSDNAIRKWIRRYEKI